MEHIKTVERTVQRVPRDVEKPRTGNWFYLAAFTFLVATSVILGLWVVRLNATNRLRQTLEDQIKKRDYAQAVGSIQELITKSPRWQKRGLIVRLQHIRLNWAEYELSQSNFAQASAQAALVAESGYVDDLARAIKLVRAQAALGQLKKDFPDLTFDERMARCRAIITNYSDTAEASEASRLLEEYQGISVVVKEEWDQLTKTVKLFRDTGRITEAIRLLGQFREKCDKKLLAELDAELFRLNGYLKSGDYELETKIRLISDTELPSASVRIHKADVDFIPLFRADYDHGVRQPVSEVSSSESSKDVFFCTLQGMLFCMSAQTGRPLWGVYQGIGMEFMPAISGDSVVCVSNWGKDLARIDSSTGKVSWCIRLPDSLAYEPIAIGEHVAVLDQKGHLRIISFASGKVNGEIDLGGSDLSYLVTDGNLRLIAAGNNRAVLFEKSDDTWLQVGCISINESVTEKVYIIGRYLFVVSPQRGLTAARPRSYLWRDRAITPVEKPNVPESWRFVEQQQDLQVWIDSGGFAHCTKLNEAAVEVPVTRLPEIGGTYIRDVCLLGIGKDTFMLTGGQSLELWSLSQSGESMSWSSKWSKKINWRVDDLQLVDQATTAVTPAQKVLVRGHDLQGPIFACLSLEGEGLILWISHPGPSPCNAPFTFGEMVGWPDSESGLLAINGEVGFRHLSADFSAIPDPAKLSVEVDDTGCLTYAENNLTLFGPQLAKLWAKPQEVPEGIAKACLLEKLVIVVTEQGKIVAFHRDNGEQLLTPISVPPEVNPCQAAIHSDESAVLLIGHNGAAMKASIVLESDKPSWSFQTVWDASDKILAVAAIKTGVLVYTSKGWQLFPQKIGTFAAGLSRFLYADAELVLMGDDSSGTVGCSYLGNGSEKWRSSMDNQAIWAHRLVNGNFIILSQGGKLSVLDSTTGQIRKQMDLYGIPTANPVIVKDQIWIPLSGYRIVKLQTADFN